MTVQVRSTTQRRRTSKRDTKYIKHLKSGRHAGKFLVSVPNGTACPEPTCKVPMGSTHYKNYGPFVEFDDALAQRDKHQREQVENNFVPVPRGRAAKPVTLAEWCIDWFALDMATNASSTQAKVRHNFNKHVLPRLGHLTLADLTKKRITQLREDLVKEGKLQGSTINYTLKWLRACLNAALDDPDTGLKENLAKKVDLIEVPRKRRKTTFAIYPPLLAAVDVQGQPNNNHLKLVLKYVLDTGCRESEVVAQHWGDLELLRKDPKTGKPAPRAVLRWHTVTSGEAKEGSLINAFRPGTKESKGEIEYAPISEEMAEMLNQYKEAMRFLARGSRPRAKMVGKKTAFFYAKGKNDRSGPTYVVPADPCADDALVFPTYDGQPLTTNNISGWFRDVCKRAGVKQTFHGMRHDSGSFKLADGVPLATVSRDLRHSSVAFTADTYMHELEEQARMGADAMGARWAALEAQEARAV